MKLETPSVLKEHADALGRYYSAACPQLAPLAGPAFLNTVETTVQKLDDGSYFVITGDIPAMWLRDSSAQLVNYVPFAKESPEVREILEGAIATQAKDVCLDPYANAFNACPNGRGFKDITQRNPSVWERKFEVDSLCAPIFLLYQYWKETGYTTPFTPTVHAMLETVAATFTCEQEHVNSPYRFQRPGGPDIDTLPNEGFGTPVAPTGMIWSGFRPSDDRCEYGYLIPSNIMACVAMKKAAEISAEIYHDDALTARCHTLMEDVERGIKTYGIVQHPAFGPIYAYETDGFGHYNLMDDANSPSLLSLPYLGFCDGDDPIYQNTRRFILSSENPYYFTGAYASGIGSPHTPSGYIWHISLIMQALTTNDRAEIQTCLDMLIRTHAGTNQMHEAFDPDDPTQFTRPWFAWANTLLAQLLEKLMREDFFQLKQS